MKLPCIENKCLLLPICKNKRNIHCDMIYEYYLDLCKTSITLNHIDRHIETVLYKVKNIFRENKDCLHYPARIKLF